MNGARNTLFILAGFGVKENKSGIFGLKANNNVFELHMKILDDYKASMKYISLHKTKSERSYTGGEITEIRLATESEIEAHQKLMKKYGKKPMANVKERKIVVFRPNFKWCCSWPAHVNLSSRVCTSTGFVERA